jgi:Fe-S oxidoreductase
VATPRGKITILREMLAGRLEPDDTGAGEFWYRCTLCAQCQLDCPAPVPLVDLVAAARSHLLERGKVPSGAGSVLRRLRLYGNPWGRPADERNPAAGAGTRRPGETDAVLYLGCLAGYDRRIAQAANALVEVLVAAGLDFALLGKEERCCGGEAYALGEEALFDSMLEANLAVFSRHGIRRIIAFCPHCYHTLKTLYPRHLDVRHYTEVLADLLPGGLAPLRAGPPRKVAYHDPCHLGRRHGLYRPPRAILGSLPAVSLLAMEAEGERALCCEAGGGRMWYDPPRGRSGLASRIADNARRAGAEVLAVACPFCLSALEPEAKERGLAVLDVAEMARSCLGRV